MNEGYERIGNILGVKPSSIKNMRDEFDPLHENERVGWHQRPLRPSRARVVEAFQSLKEEEMRDFVLEILTNPNSITSDFLPIIESIANREADALTNPVYIIRGPTGRKAEEYFIDYYERNQIPIQGRLEDTRDFGCGYDFKIINDNHEYQIEVKGLDNAYGGIVFSSKEWEMAKVNQESYFLCVVKNLSDDPDIFFINNPAEKLNPHKSVYTTVQIQWAVSAKDLGKNSC